MQRCSARTIQVFFQIKNQTSAHLRELILMLANKPAFLHSNADLLPPKNLEHLKTSAVSHS